MIKLPKVASVYKISNQLKTKLHGNDKHNTLKVIGHFRNVRGLGKSMVVFRLFEKLKYSNERSTIF